MKKNLLIALSFLAFTSPAIHAGTRTLVEYGTVQQSQIITHTREGYHPLRTLAAGTIGGVVGHQFGNGKGNTAVTVAGATAGAVASHNQQSSELAAQEVKLLIKTHSGQTIQVVQHNNGPVFNAGDNVRILTTGSNTTVEKSY
ncbi:glycine zipper 2TM domain-containing protein [Enterobacter hormaechei]|uniref:glycine zipper 2TM domain-containing protein n=1 Tax=Enterobacter hormaechei TaxID=158836 RepID=UPI003CF6EE2A